MPSVDLASSPLRELNSALHALTDNTNATHWTVSCLLYTSDAADE